MNIFAAVLTAVQILAPRMFSHAILPWVRKLHVASYTVLIDLGLAELRSVRDSVALRSYADSQSHSDSRARPRKARSYIG